jgi:hypothetical protein
MVPDGLLCVPTGQLTQATLAELFWYLPLSQTTQLDKPTSGESEKAKAKRRAQQAKEPSALL